MAANPDWARWIFASVADVLKAVATEAELAVLIEHFDERTDAFMKASDRAEIRITGPFVRQTSPDCFTIWVDTNVLLTSRYDGKNKNPFSIMKFAGLFQEAMGLPIPVWNYGPEMGDFVEDDEDTQVFIGCLLPRSGKNDSVRVIHFGQTDKTDKYKQSVVDGRYVMYLP